MKIVDKCTVKFLYLKVGDVFRFKDLYCIKTENRTDSGMVLCNAVNIENGQLVTFCGSDEVQKLNATLIIEGEEE